MSTKQDPKSAVIQKALTDPAFKAELLKNPAAAVEKATGLKLPPGVQIKIVEDSASNVHLVLPPSAPKGELGAADLSKVAGGYGMLGTQAGGCGDSTAQKC